MYAPEAVRQVTLEHQSLALLLASVYRAGFDHDKLLALSSNAAAHSLE
jgi:hypothetical protein